MSKTVIAGSLLSADLSNLEKEFDKFVEWGLEVMHIDVMDGHFAPNLTFGPYVFKNLSGGIKIPVDIHLMVQKPMEYLERFADIFNVGEFISGRNWYGIHVEVYMEDGVLDCDTLKKDLVEISSKGFLTSVVINPDTGVDFLNELLKEGLVDKVLVMTVWPGFSGQEMISECLDKVSRVVKMVADSGVYISVDGGVNENTITLVHERGADFIVSGSYLMKSKDKEEFKKKLNLLQG